MATSTLENESPAIEIQNSDSNLTVTADSCNDDDNSNNNNNNNNTEDKKNDDSDDNNTKLKHNGSRNAHLSAFDATDLKNSNRNYEEEESFHNVGHQIFLRVKNRNSKRVRTKGKVKLVDSKSPDEVEGNIGGVSNGGKILLKAWSGLFQIVLDWIIDVVVAIFHFSQGRYYTGALTLAFVFVGGAFVNFSLNVLMLRKGDKEFKEELRRCNPILPYIMHIPSFLPFFSCGLNVHTARKLRKEKDPIEIKRLERMMKICEEHIVTDLMYESAFEAFPQAILQSVILLEKVSYPHAIDFLPILAVISAWYGISTAPITLAKSLNNLKVTVTEVIAGLANKGVTLLAFAMFITSSRQYFADPLKTNMELILATVISVLVLTFVADVPGIIAFELEMKSRQKAVRERAARISRGERARGRRLKSDWRYFINFISLIIPLTAISFWSVTLSEKDELLSVKYIAVTSAFTAGFCVAFIGFCCNRSLPWLGQFSTDVLVLLFIGFQSNCRKMIFRDIDFQYDTHSQVEEINGNEPGNSDSSNNNNEEKTKSSLDLV